MTRRNSQSNSHSEPELTPSAILNRILREAKIAADSGRPIRAVFDLDSTIFEVAPRSQRILSEFLETKENHPPFATFFERLREVQIQPDDWGLKSAVERHGLFDMPEELRNALIQFWRKRFFSDDYLKWDTPYEGAVEFVLKLQTVGTQIYYLTGRDEERMGRGTREILRHWGLPTEKEGATLILKKKAGGDDGSYKAEALKKIDGTIWFFENEPAIILPVLEHCPQVQVVFFDSTHSRKATAPDHLPKIKHYRLDEE